MVLFLTGPNEGRCDHVADDVAADLVERGEAEDVTGKATHEWIGPRKQSALVQPKTPATTPHRPDADRQLYGTRDMTADAPKPRTKNR